MHCYYFPLDNLFRTLTHRFCQSERIVKDFLYSWGSIWSPDISWSQLGCMQLPVSYAHDSESPQLDFQLLKNLFKYQTVLKRQEAWDCIKRYAIFSLWKCIYFSKMLFKMIFAFQSHQATPGYVVSYRSQSVRQAVLLGMLCLLIGRICSAREGMISNRFGPWVL